jgi:hypothetical protein
MGHGTEGLEMIRDEIHGENEGVTVPVQVRWLASCQSIKERRQKAEISASSVLFVLNAKEKGRRSSIVYRYKRRQTLDLCKEKRPYLAKPSITAESEADHQCRS